MLFLFGKGNGMPEDLLDTSLDITRKKTFLQKCCFYRSLKINSLNVVGILQKKIQGVEGVEFPDVF